MDSRAGLVFSSIFEQNKFHVSLSGIGPLRFSHQENILPLNHKLCLGGLDLISYKRVLVSFTKVHNLILLLYILLFTENKF